MKTPIALLFGLTLASCASAPPVKMTCGLWDLLPATEHRKFIYQGNFTDPLAEVAEVAGSDRRSITGACRELQDSKFVLGTYQP